MASSLNGRQKKALSEHAGVVILEYYNGDPPPWSHIGTQTQAELRALVIDRLHDKACGDVAEILSSNASEYAIRAIQQRFKSLREKKKRNDKNKKGEAQGYTFSFRCERCSWNPDRYPLWSWKHEFVERGHQLRFGWWYLVYLHPSTFIAGFRRSLLFRQNAVWSGMGKYSWNENNTSISRVFCGEERIKNTLVLVYKTVCSYVIKNDVMLL